MEVKTLNIQSLSNGYINCVGCEMSRRHERQHLYKLGRNICTLSEKQFDTKWYIQDNQSYGIFKKHA